MIHIFREKIKIAALFIIIMFCTIPSYLICGNTLSSEEKLIERIQIYYKQEKLKDWDETYHFRPPSFKEVVSLSTYKKIMDRDSQGWQLIQSKVIDIKIKDKSARVRILFIDKFPEGYLPKSASTDSIEMIEVARWEEIDGVWYARDPGGRSYLTLNIDLVEN